MTVFIRIKNCPIGQITGCFRNFSFASSLYQTSPRLNVKSVASNKIMPARIVDRVIKSEEDKRAYRALELQNGIKVMLISDPETDKSAASLTVNVGHLSDPNELPGLAHFCEHMLFMGTEKYPEENDYQKFLTTHAGSSNAYTATDHTNFFFDVAPEHLVEILDRFAQFFLKPLFSESATEREVNAVDSENRNNLQNDTWRLAQLERSLSDPNHAYSKFGTGSKVTLYDDAIKRGLEPRKELLKFHEKFYSSNIMGLCVLGKENLDTLQDMIIGPFSEVRNIGIEPLRWEVHPYGPEQLGNYVSVLPIKDVRALHLSFPIPDLHPYYKSDPGSYLGHLLGHEGPGSLLSELKRLGWCNSLSAGPRTGARGFAFFSVDVELTEEGEKHLDDITVLIFQHIKLLEEDGIHEWIHRECEAVNNMLFRFKDKENPQSYVRNISTVLHEYPLEEVLYAPYMMPDFKPELISMVHGMLRPDNMVVVYVSKVLEGKTTQTEQWYGTKYSVEPISKDLVNKCWEASRHPSLRVPPKNEFIPTTFTLAPSPSDPSKLPQLISDDPLCRIWHLQDREYLLPKNCIFMEMSNNLSYLDPFHRNAVSLFTMLVDDSLNEYAYAASLAGLHYGIAATKYGIQLSISGYHEKQKVLLEKLLERIVSFKPDPKRFAVIKERYIRSLKNFKMEQPYQHAIYYTSTVLAEKAWTKEELLQECDALTFERLEDFLKQMFSSLFIEAFVHGNATKEDALELVKVATTVIAEHGPGTRPMFSSQLKHFREVNLPEGKSYGFEVNNDYHENSALEVYLQCGVECTKENMLLELLCQILNEPVFDQLRTKEQLGYIVWSGARRAHGTQGLRLIVQSERDPGYVETRVDAVLESVLKDIEEMPDSEFEKQKIALATKRLEKPKKLGQCAAKHWNEIQSQLFNFDRDNVEVECLRTISKDELLTYYKDVVLDKSCRQKRLSVFVRGTAARRQDVTMDDQGSGDSRKEHEMITDIYSFRDRLPLYPLPEPFTKIPSRGAKARL